MRVEELMSQKVWAASLPMTFLHLCESIIVVEACIQIQFTNANVNVFSLEIYTVLISAGQYQTPFGGR